MKNAFLVIKSCFCYFIIILFSGCSHNPDLVLLNFSKGSNIKEFPKQVELTYKGFKIGKANLINTKGDYNIEFINEYISTCESDYFLVKNDVFGSSYYLDVTKASIRKGDLESYTIDTCYYSFKETSIENKRIDNVIKTFKNLVDTLRISKSPRSH